MTINNSYDRGDTKSASPVEVFEKINNHQLEGIMFHDSLISLFDFLYLPGFKRWQMHQYKKECKERVDLKRYVMKTRQKILKDTIDKPSEEIVPSDWYGYTRFDVTPALRKQYIESIFVKYKEWEIKTKALYEHCAKTLYDNGNIVDSCEVKKLAKCVDKELACVNKYYLKLKAVAFDPEFVYELQHHLHKKYK